MRIPHRNSVLKQGPDVTNIELQHRSCVAHRIKFSIDHTSHLCSLGRGFLDVISQTLRYLNFDTRSSGELIKVRLILGRV